MKTLIIAPAVAALLALASGIAAGSVHAQSLEKSMQARVAAGVAKMESACASDIKKFCSKVTPGEGRMIYCMEAYEDQLSAKCLATVYDAAQNAQLLATLIRDVTAACRDDAVKACGKVQVGHGRVLQCLIDNKSTVSASCAGAVQKVSDFAAAK